VEKNKHSIDKQVFKNYIDLGISVIPCNKYKKPLVKWEDFQKRLPTEVDVDAWFSKYPTIEAIAMVTGNLSGICIIDLDFQLLEDNKYYNSFLLLKEFVDTRSIKLVSKTPRQGSHFWFKSPDNCPTNTVNIFPKIDFRGEGGYALIPPSVAWDSDGLKNHEYKEGKYTFETEFDSLKNIIKTLDILPPKMMDLLSTSTQKSVYKVSTTSTSVYNHFLEGQRDNDLFKVAMCLADGKCSETLMREAIHRIALSCNFSEKEAELKVESAIKRYFRKVNNLSQEVREWVLSTNGYFLSTDIYNCLQVSTREDKKNLSIIMKRLVEEGIIEKDKKQNGKWRKKDTDETLMDLNQAILPPIDIWLPCNLHNIASLRPKNIMVVAGVSNTGKTAWLLNIAKNNKNVFYFNSEMEIGELKEKLSSFQGGIKAFKHVTFLERGSNFSDVIRPDAINIIDFLEIHEEHYKMGLLIKEIHDRLGKGVCIIAIQKDKNKDFGVGGVSTLEKSRIYVNLDNDGSYQKATIIKAKIIKDKKRNPNQASMRYWVTNGGTTIEAKTSWKNDNYEYPSFEEKNDELPFDHY
jgi:hypothetical protein